jgi:hypothetical protein
MFFLIKFFTTNKALFSHHGFVYDTKPLLKSIFRVTQDIRVLMVKGVEMVEVVAMMEVVEV